MGEGRVGCRQGGAFFSRADEGYEQMAKDRILVVDPEEPIREMISKVGNPLGVEVVKATNGKEALEILDGGFVILLVTDITSLEAGGFELMQAARAKFPVLPIICMTASSSPHSYTDVMASGATDYIKKPFTIDEVTAKLNRFLRERQLVTELKEKLVELERVNEEHRRLDQLKANFIGGVSHELRTPLTVIKETFSLVLEGHVGTLTEDQKEYLGIANKNILRLINLIDTLFDFSRIESGKELKLRFEPVRLIPVVEEAWMTLSQQLEEKKIVFENRLDLDTPPVLADRRRLVEVFAQLIGNRMKFNPSGGKIMLDSKGLTEKRDYIKLIMTDTGSGISPEDLPRVFDRFYQGQKVQEGATKFTGLGLAIIKEIIEGHQGSIEVENKSGDGVLFIFTLPLFGVSTISGLLLIPMLKEAEESKTPFSVIQVEFWDQRTKRESTLSDGVLEGVVYAIRMMVRSVDVVIPFHKDRVYIFAFVDKKLAQEIGQRVQTKLAQGGYIPKGTAIQFKTYSYPKEARTQDDFLKGCRLLLKED
jgi:signal transduction histidine kinase